MTILSIDPGIELCGYAIFDRNDKDHRNFKYITSGLISTKKVDSREIRLSFLAKEVISLFKKYKPAALIMEQLFFARNVTSAIAVAQAQGVILAEAGKNNIKVTMLTPNQIKQIITGYGNSDKKAVQKMLRLTLGLEQEVKQDDVADAIACGAAFCYLNPVLKA